MMLIGRLGCAGVLARLVIARSVSRLGGSIARPMATPGVLGPVRRRSVGALASIFDFSARGHEFFSEVDYVFTLTFAPGLCSRALLDGGVFRDIIDFSLSCSMGFGFFE